MKLKELLEKVRYELASVNGHWATDRSDVILPAVKDRFYFRIDYDEVIAEVAKAIRELE